ncbi:tetratricopeptide repeat protein [Thermophagus xiamenensis]|uniref:TPR repeat-containing protein n=1 Tax=Thermophagus xiamenensis TaxID=385682 RepID=A0A1I1WNL9_9BACT|nr:tetratricopeptide repeat protein [Thermophagus xiamenensis]SFD94700.1 TPR repeat-containing protein [Thermophagus xiamenensis]
MKKLLFIALALFLTGGIYAQKGKVNAAEAYLDNGDIEAAEVRLNAAMEHPKSKDWPKTYIVSAKLATAKYKKSKDIQLLKNAVDYYLKALELDKANKGRFENEIKIALTLFVSDLTNAGIEGFNEQKYENAMIAFENVLKINDLELFQAENPTVDTAIIYNTALAAYNAKNWEKAADYLKKAISYKYGGGDAVLLLHQVYSNMGDSTDMASNLKNGFEMYPEDDRLLTQLINYYLETRQNEQALEYLNQAIEKDPNNATFLYARGVLLDQSKEFDKAIADYKKALELKEDYFEPLYNLGVIYYNKGVEQMNIANAETDHAKFKEKKAKADSLFKSALPFMEKASSLRPEDTAVLESLKSLYYRFEMNDKYDEVTAKLNSIRGN